MPKGLLLALNLNPVSATKIFERNVNWKWENVNVTLTDTYKLTERNLIIGFGQLVQLNLYPFRHSQMEKQQPISIQS